MDRRQKKTREAIFRAFTKLLGHEAYAKITVQEIINAADIGRTTFYAHFETKDELLESLCSTIFEHVFSEDPGKEKTHDFSKNHDTKARITHILYHLQEHMDYLPNILSGEGGEIFMHFFRADLREIFASVSESAYSIAPRDYILNHMVCDFTETVKWWTHNKNYSPEEISAFFIATTPLSTPLFHNA